jgi:hypothetical protein
MRKVTKESGKFNASSHNPTPARAKFSARRALRTAIIIFFAFIIIFYFNETEFVYVFQLFVSRLFTGMPVSLK